MYFGWETGDGRLGGRNTGVVCGNRETGLAGENRGQTLGHPDDCVFYLALSKTQLAAGDSAIKKMGPAIGAAGCCA